MRKVFLLFLLVFWGINLLASEVNRNIFVITIDGDINSRMWIYARKGMSEAVSLNSDLLVVSINTYGGELQYADSIATLLMKSKLPTIAFVDNNAASAGALIAIACDKIYMRSSGRIGAATVVDGIDGKAMPDKYQSYMRAIMRAAAESHGRDSIGGWYRDPLIAEAMVDPNTIIPDIDDSTNTLTLTTQEAIKYRYCEGQAESIEQILQAEHIDEYSIHRFVPSVWDSIKGFVTSPFVRGLLIVLIIGGIWFELQQPGIGFPLAVAVVSALLYFAPLYIDGLAANWEIILFVVGLLLLAVEIFIIPGFGIAGIGGILLIILSLTFALLDNDVFDFRRVAGIHLSSAILTVTIGVIAGFALMLYLSHKIGSKGIFAKFALLANQKIADGFIGVSDDIPSLVGQRGVAVSDLRPVGKVDIGGRVYDAISKHGRFIASDTDIEVVGYSAGQLLVSVCV
jgi:stomatin family stomatin/podocin/band 7/nephorsis.2 SPFH protein (fragment)